ncbi:MAG TPA: chitosanase [Candidatus Acidoferrales bacterium]|nr:chitosanase [Candidatus Acidoferrales bacterium]
MLTDLQKRTIQAIVNVFETGKPAGDYANVTLLPGDAGHLTYGRSQTTLASGNLCRLIEDYCAAAAGSTAADLLAYLPRLAAPDLTLDGDAAFRALLRQAGADPVMHRVQDEFFDRAYWEPSLRAAQHVGLDTPLATAVVYDSFIHGAWKRIHDATTAQLGLPSASGASAATTDERVWVREYIALRRDWLATHPNPVLRRAVYRMDTFAALAEAGNWELALPVVAHGVTIDEPALAGNGRSQLATASLAAAGDANSKSAG